MDNRNIYYGAILFFIYKQVLNMIKSITKTIFVYSDLNIYLLVIFEVILSAVLLYTIIMMANRKYTMKPTFFILFLVLSILIFNISTTYYSEEVISSKKDLSMINMFETAIESFFLLLLAIVMYIKYYLARKIDTRKSS